MVYSFLYISEIVPANRNLLVLLVLITTMVQYIHYLLIGTNENLDSVSLAHQLIMQDYFKVKKLSLRN